MKNKNVGFLVVGIAIVMGLLVLVFNNGMRDVVNQSCSHGPSCSMWGTIKTQTWIGITLVGIVLVVGLVLIFTKEEERIIVKIKKIKEKIKKKSKPIDYSKLGRDEKVVVKVIEEAKGAIFQSDIVDKSEFSKVKVTRILDKLEGQGLIERKRRGMTNMVVLSDR
ncbi:MarR family transcriptional regulator [Candidatus Pacearchaeota archaeon]|nr:MarR family transcriptional regulator [Candidatus Pacearchaeota archaeon]